jgi:osmoprotectant transport system permease protein
LATVPLAAVVGSGGLGRYIIDGFATRDYAEVGAGVTLVVALVLINELVFAVLTRWASGGTRRPRSARRRDAAATS